MSPTDERPEKEEVKVRDRRKFDDRGELKQEPGAENRAGEKAEAETDEGEEPQRSETETAGGQGSQLPQMNFAAFILSLSTMALVYMGDVPNPETKKREKNLDLAKQHIDILGILQEKTQGNLTQEEEKLLKNLLFELRMKYVALSK